MAFDGDHSEDFVGNIARFGMWAGLWAKPCLALKTGK